MAARAFAGNDATKVVLAATNEPLDPRTPPVVEHTCVAAKRRTLVTVVASNPAPVMVNVNGNAVGNNVVGENDKVDDVTDGTTSSEFPT